MKHANKEIAWINSIMNVYDRLDKLTMWNAVCDGVSVSVKC